MTRADQPGGEVDYSVIVATRNSERHINECLESLLAQGHLGAYEILVVDGLSVDGTRDIVTRLQKGHPQILLLDNHRRITPAAFNLGVLSARGRYVLTVGDHWELPADFFRRIQEAFDRHPEVDCLGGRIIRVATTPTGRAIELARASAIGGGLSQRNSRTTEGIVTEANIAYVWRRTVFDRVGLFDERFVKNQDNEFNMRTLLAGLKTLYSPQIEFAYHVPDSHDRLFRQVFGYSSYTPMMQVKHRRPVNLKYALPACALTLWLAAWASVILGAGAPGIPLALLAIYLLAVGAGAAYVCARSRAWHQLLKVAFALLVIHSGTGVGFLHGVLRLLDFHKTRQLWQDFRSLPRIRGAA